MASTNSYDFVVTRDNLITDALLEIGVLRDGGTATTDQLTACARTLNMLVKSRANDAVFRWTYKRGYLLPVTDVSSVATNSHVVTFYDSTTIATAAVSGASSIVIAAAGTIANSDSIGIELDSGDMHWTTVSNISSTTVTLTDVLTDDVAVGNRVYAYTASTDRVQRPLEITQANTLEASSGNQTDVEIIDRNEYFRLQNRDDPGDPIKLYYEEILGSNTASPDNSTTWYGNLFIWPRFQNGDKVIEFSYRRPIQDFDAASDTPDLPQEYYLPVVKELAALLCGRYGVPSDTRKQLFAEAQLYYSMAETTEEKVKIEPNLHG